jgi:hypothetical protein
MEMHFRLLWGAHRREVSAFGGRLRGPPRSVTLCRELEIPILGSHSSTGSTLCTQNRGPRRGDPAGGCFAVMSDEHLALRAQPCVPLTTDSRRVAGESVVRVVAQRRALEECLEDGTRAVPQLDGGGGVGSLSELFTRLPSSSAHSPRARCRALHRRASKTNALTSTAFCMLVEISHGVQTGHGETP